ncbi:class I SAM-dependent methyltransferase [Spirochaetota bacterium]
MNSYEYLMESDEEVARLELKTNREAVEKQALWAGIKPGMRVADIGCGSGKTTHFLHELVQPNGEAVGVDYSETRIQYAKENYAQKGLEFVRENIYNPLDHLGKFDFIWVRFFLEYHRSNSFELVKNISNILKPGGILCLLDMDNNCMNHFGLSPRLAKAISGMIDSIEDKNDFDPFTGKKLYSFLYDLDYLDIDVNLFLHNIIFGEIKQKDAFNWIKKVDMAVKRTSYDFDEYGGDSEMFLKEFKKYIMNPRRFIYNTLISCRGRKP